MAKEYQDLAEADDWRAQTWESCMEVAAPKTSWAVREVCALTLQDGSLFLVAKNFEAINEQTLKSLEAILGSAQHVDRVGSDEEFNAILNAIWSRPLTSAEVNDLEVWQAREDWWYQTVREAETLNV